MRHRVKVMDESSGEEIVNTLVSKSILITDEVIGNEEYIKISTQQVSPAFLFMSLFSFARFVLEENVDDIGRQQIKDLIIKKINEIQV